jgi:hypothetical protein
LKNPIKILKLSLESGGIGALALFILSGSAMLGFLLLTVHDRSQINLSGFNDFSLPGIHNQLLPLLSASFLGYLSMRLARRFSVSTPNAYILGLGTHMVYQSFPNNLWFYWKTYPAAWWILFLALFWTLEESSQYYKTKQNFSSWMKVIVLTGMYCADGPATLFLIICNGLVSYRNLTQASNWASFFQSVKLPIVLGGAILIGKYILLYMEIYAPTGISGELFLQAYCDEGVRGLMLKSLPPQLPGWNILLVSGIISIIAVLAFVREKEHQFFHPAILLSGVAAFFFSKIVFPETFYANGIYDTYLAFPLFLAFFTLLPAWLEKLNGHSGIFVLIAIALAFCATFVQLRNYAMLYPIPGPSFYDTCLSGPFYH